MLRDDIITLAPDGEMFTITDHFSLSSTAIGPVCLSVCVSRQ